MRIEDNRALAAKKIDTTNMCSHLQRKLFDAEGDRVVVLFLCQLLLEFGTRGNKG